MLPLTYEISVLAARGADGGTATWSPVKNMHRDGILFLTIMPSCGVSDDVVMRIRAIVTMTAEEMGYVGVLRIKFFMLWGDSLVVNEMTPHPYNPSCITMDVYEVNQFEQQARVMACLPLDNTR